MSTYPKAMKEALVIAGVPLGKSSKAYVVDPANGSDDNHGMTLGAPLLTVGAAYAKCVDGQNDVVVLLGGATAALQTAALTWAKSYTHLIGLCATLDGVGQRCRITSGASSDCAVVMTVSGSGCVFRNVQFYNGSDADVDSGAVVVSGSRNLFDSCFFAGGGHATPAARAGSYSLKVSGAENVFRRCAIGLDTIVRVSAPELVLASGACRNSFNGCRIFSYSETAATPLVTVADGVDRWNEFEDVVFHSFSANWAVTRANAFNIAAAATHQIILRGSCQLVGITGWSDTLTHVYLTAPAPSTAGGTQVNPVA